jgi:uncharacterized protein (TIGR03000 family)
MIRTWLTRLAYSTLALGALAFAGGTALAQKGGGHGGGHGGGGEHGGGSHGGEWHGGSNWGWGGYGYFPYYYGGFGRGLWGGYGGYPGYYGYGSYPYSSYRDYAPDYGYAQTAPQQSIDPNAALIGVRVPEHAEIWIDGSKTSQTGSMREFVTPPLDPGQKFNYDVKARWTENGQEVVRERQVSFHAGDRLMVNMMAPQQKSNEPARPQALNPPTPVP